MKFAHVLAIAAIGTALPAFAYDGTKCKAAGNCWEPKPGYPAKVEGSKYDPKHDATELAKNSDAVKGMEARNAKRLENFRKTGTFKYDAN